MKSAQWLAVIVLAMMVGGLTFVMVYLGGSNSKTNQPEPKELPSLTFALKRFPVAGYPAPTTEIHQVGYQDFWFENNTGQNLSLGLNRKGCTCSQVGIALAPESWRQRFASEAGLRLIQRATYRVEDFPTLGLENLPRMLATYQYERIFPEVPEQEVKMNMLSFDNSFEVPQGALGFIRLSWERKESGPLRTAAELWTVRRESGASATLEVEVKITKPMEVQNKDITTDPIDYRELTKGKAVWIVCYSFTRPAFSVKAELIRDHGTAESDPIELGQPIPFTPGQIRRMSTELNMRTLSGYRIPLTVKATAKDGTPISWGNFRRLVRLTSPDPAIEPVQVQVSGEIRGDVSVSGIKEGGGINLGPFPRSHGTKGEVILQTDEPNLELELDTARVPEYMKVQFPKEAEKSPTGSLREWRVRIEIPPNKASGDFPRSDDPVYRDSAIYVKTKEKTPHTIRIPVHGTANDG